MDNTYVERHGSRKTDQYLLTNISVWPEGIGTGTPLHETGVQSIVEGRLVDTGFSLYEHGWSDFEAANTLILRTLDKGWSAHRATQVMRRINGKQKSTG